MALNDANRKYVLANDIALTGTWTAIGTDTNTAFKGKLYGNGHTIRGLKLGNTAYAGLFGVATDA